MDEVREVSGMTEDELIERALKKAGKLAKVKKYLQPGEITIKMYADKHEVSRATAKEDLNGLVEAGLAEVYERRDPENGNATNGYRIL